MAATDIHGNVDGTVEMLRAMERELKKVFFDPETPSRDKATLSRQLLIVHAQLVQAIGDEAEQKLDAALTNESTETFDASSV